MAEDSADKNQTRLVRWLRITHVLTAVSAIVAGALGAWLADDYGPGAAMYWAITAGNTEPATPRMDYPWLGFWLGMLLSIGGTGMLAGRRGWLVGGVSAISIGALILVLLPFFHIWRLVGAT